MDFIIDASAWMAAEAERQERRFAEETRRKLDKANAGAVRAAKRAASHPKWKRIAHWRKGGG